MTVTVQVAFLPLDVFAVIFVFPAFKPFTVPADDTLATLLLEELQVTPFVAVTGVMEAVNLEE